MTSSSGIEAWFIKSLADAGNCHKHALRKLPPSSLCTARRPSISTRKRQSHVTLFQRDKHTHHVEATGREGADAAQDGVQDEVEDAPVEPNRTREELLELVDQYSWTSYTDQLPLLDVPQLYQPSDGPHLTVSAKPEDEWPPPNYTWPADAQTKSKIEALRRYMSTCFYAKEPTDPDEVYRLYRALPSPRAPYLSANLRHRMMHNLSVVEKKDEHSMLRYLSVVDDLKVSAIPLSPTEWTSAISFVARYVHRSTEAEVEAALLMWKEMEHEAGIKATGATFNVLFDVACKAGKLVLAEMVYKEMANRGIEYDRFHHVSLIWYYGLRQSGDGVRAAYKALVEAGEIVDTVVLNAMISGLIRSFESSAAEGVYGRMKRWHLQRENSQLPPRDYHQRRVVNLALVKLGKLSKNNLGMRENFQNKSIIAPDVHTFELLITHHASTSGDLEKIGELLDEMRIFGLGVCGQIFVRLLQGFATHGGIRYTQWTEARLESVWSSLLQALDDEVEGVYFSKWMATRALQAFSKCSGRDRTMQVWKEIRARWKDAEEGDLDFVMGNLRAMVEKPDAAPLNKDFFLNM
ncbi:pentatricopeptide repeat protein [Diplocarpon rosae]|nr:pentatricopeptide repeat protein [Diplocarpon rosae]